MRYRNKLQEIYSAELPRCPFTNITPIWQFHGHEVAEHFGGTCITQAARLAMAIRSELSDVLISFHGARPEPLRCMNHGAMIAGSPDQKELFLFEPGYLAARPIPLQEVLEEEPGSMIASSATLPIYGGNLGSVNVQLGEQEVNKRKLFVTIEGSNGDVRNGYPLYLDQPIQIPEGRTPYVPGSGQMPTDRLEMCLVNQKFGTCRITLNTSTTIDKERIRIKHKPCDRIIDSQDRSRKALKHELDTIAQTIGTTGKKLREFLFGGLELYRQTPDLSSIQDTPAAGQ